jgi:DNA-binding LacI/PurR family transcriptional regulator
MSSVAERYQAYTDFMLEASLGDTRQLTRLISPKGPDELYFEQLLVRDALGSLLNRPDPITAIFCANEHFMYVASELLLERQSSLPRSFEISAFCDWPRIHSVNIRLNLIRQDAAQIGRAAASLLDEALRSESGASGQVRLLAPVGSVENLFS